MQGIVAIFAMLMESRILQGLNPAQLEAVTNYDEPSLIIAGAGSGKTRVLTSRIAYMIEQGVKPFNIIAMTFTNKAANEMRSRIRNMIPDLITESQARSIWMGTFHSICVKILRVNADRIGFPETFTIYEPSDVKNLLKTIIRDMNLSDDKYKPNAIASRISYAKNCLVTPGAYLSNAAYGAEDRQKQIPEFGNIYNVYCQRCKQNGAMDFDDLLLQTNILLRDCKDVLASYQEQFQYVLVDEYQDTNYAQYIIIRRLSQLHNRVCVVGDDAQSIYSFRGAKIENILNFQRDYPAARVFKLEQNYRSTQTIVEAANSVIAHNSHRMEKNCFSEGDKGAPVHMMRAYTDREEAELVVSDLREKVRQSGAAWSDVAVLYRTNSQSLAFEESMRRKGIPYRIYRGSSFYDHKEIKDMLGYLRLIINPRDDEAFKRIVNYPARGIGDTTVQRIEALARSRGVSMWEAVDSLVAETALSPAADAATKAIVRKVTEFVKLINDLSLARADRNIYEFGMEVASRSGILGALRAENTPDAQSAVDNIEELLNSMQDFKEQRDAEIRNGEREENEEATVEEWLQSVMLMTDMDNDDPEGNDKVTLMTVHSAKGLEYEYVYVVGMEENLFPSQRAMETMEGLEEERRLFYVALTRAKREATLSYAEMRYKWGNMEFSRPSRFLGEIDEKYIDADFDLKSQMRSARSENEERSSAIDELRHRYDVRYADRRRDDSAGGGYGRQSGRYGGGQGSFGAGRDSFGGERRVAGQRLYDVPERRPVQRVEPVRTSTEGMRSVGVRRSDEEPAAAVPCGYAAGERVEHVKFGRGSIVRVEAIAGDHKVVVAFDDYGEKTLLAKFAKLRKLQ